MTRPNLLLPGHRSEPSAFEQERHHVPVGAAKREAGSCQRGKLSLPLASHAGRSQIRFVAALDADRFLTSA